MNRAFYNGISGAKTQQFGIDTWGNNIANINTNGYRANLPQFAELFSNKLDQIKGTGPVESDQGFGARAHSSATSMKTGSIVNTDNDLDIAILGEGWFGVAGGVNQQLQFTRAGNFMTNKDGHIVNGDGAFLMGTMNKEVAEGVLKDVNNFVPLDGENGQTLLKLPQDLRLGAVPTTKVSLHGNLGVSGEMGKFSTHIINDAGEKQTIDIRFTKDEKQADSGSAWIMNVSIKDLSGNSLFDAEPTPILFGSNGGIVNYTPPVIKNGDKTIKLSLGDAQGSLFAIDSQTIGKDIRADGIPQGNIVNYNVDKTGHIVGNFDNGRSSAVGRIALYHFQNDQGLSKIGDNRFTSSSNSGEAFFYTDAEGRATPGTPMMSNALEKSNTSTAEALTQLIVLQKAFDASAKSITTGDQLIQAALKML